MPQSAESKYHFYLVNNVHFDNLSGMNKLFLFKGKIVKSFHEYFAFLEHIHRRNMIYSQEK